VPDPSGDPGERLDGHGRRLRLLVAHLAGRAVRARVEPEDLVQEVYLRALSAPEAWPAPEPGDAALGRWLARVARHVVVDAARAIRAAKRDAPTGRLAPSAWSRVGPAARVPGPRTLAQAAEGERRLLAAYERLAPEHRRVIGLRQFRGLSAREAAARMGRSEPAVHSLYRRALAAWEDASAPRPPKKPGSSGESGLAARPAPP